MRSLVVIGVVIAALGAYVLFQGASYRDRHNVLKVGDLHASVTERHQVPAWAGGVALAVGLVLVGAGARRRGA